MTEDPNAKNPFDAALDQFTTDANRDVVLTVLHGLLSATWTQSVLDGAPESQTAAEARIFSRMIRWTEKKLNKSRPNVSPQKQVKYGGPPPPTSKPA